MTYQLKELGDDRFELFELRPRSVGVLTNRRIAERFVDFLDSIDEEHQQVLEDIEFDIPLPQPDAITIEDGDFDPSQHPGFLQPEATPAPAPAPELAKPVEDETPLREAYRRLEAGEQLSVVADETGIAMPKLRGLWANKIRYSKEAANQDEAMLEAECTTCRRRYRPSASDEGLCSRCVRDLGRS
ncbi:hypothetical protein H4P12_08325 [Paracoccus sp. 11-3]|uniref:Uncharacterized protein n=1 Tax=Paracoccus amoyensis TaxID=2760093 RepID=A0A926GGP2_9RHOB|nr:hypothetical protein [Paracoccus amoyensis]MBC9246717.1 hypothetical protein [Paracoccus amoyensis]